MASIADSTIKEKPTRYLNIIFVFIVSGFIVIIGYLISLTFIMQGFEVPFFFLGILAGIAAFFNPCALPLFPAFLSHIYATGQYEERTPWNAARLGAFGALGIVTPFAIFGTLVLTLANAGIGSILKELLSINSIYWTFRAIIGLGLLYFGGILVLRKGEFWIHFGENWLGVKTGRPHLSMFLYGISYTIMALGCGAPIIGGTILTTLAAGDLIQISIIFVFIGITMGILMLILTLVVKGGGVLSTPWPERGQQVFGVIFILVGLYLIMELLFPNLRTIIRPFLNY